MNPKIVVLAAAACTFAFPALAQTSSGIGRTVAYTETSGKTCKTLSNQGEGEIVEWKCRGVGRDPFFIDAVTLGGVAFGKDGEHEPGFTPSQEFTGKKIEWRLQDGKPYATIYRAYVNVEVQSTPVPKSITRQVLVVTKLNGENACHIAYVDASIQNANAKAAEIADANVSSFTCGSDKPLRVGNPPAFRD